MARYIDADKLLEELQQASDKEGVKADVMANAGVCDASVKYSHGHFCYINAMEIVKDAPSVDVVKVVRCKDCIWFQSEFVQTPNGERRPYTEEELKNGRCVTMDVGINCGSRCERYERWEENSIPVWCNGDDFCSYGKRKGDT